MEEIKLGKVCNAKILVANRDRRTNRMNGLNGLVITFETEATITNSTVIYMVYDDKRKPFKVQEVEISGNKLIGHATETGNHTSRLSQDENLDLRKLIGCDVELIEDKEVLMKIHDQSLWC